MSRGLGTAQRLMLKALASLEAEHGSGEGLFYVWAIVDHAYAVSPEMRARHQAWTEAHERREAAIREKAAAGDDRAQLYLSLGRALRRGRPSPRTRRTSPSWVTETEFNPSRVLASLARRGLVKRNAVKGGGAAGLTDAGREAAAVLSVGSSCAEKPETAPAVEMPDA